MKTRLLITALLGFLFTAPAVAQVDSAAICRGQDAKFNIADGAKTGDTPLHTAAEANACVSAARLIAEGANIHAYNKFNSTPLHVAATDNAVETAKLLIAHSADVNARNDVGFTPLHFATSEVAELLIAHGADVNASAHPGAPTMIGSTPLHVAATSDDRIEVAKLLIANGAVVDAYTVVDEYFRDVSTANTSLHVAAFVNAVEVAELLIANGANVNAHTNLGETPLDQALDEGHNQMIELLRTHGGGCNKKCP